MHWRRRNKRRLAVLLAALVIGVVGVSALRAVREAQHERLVAEARQAGLASFAAGDMDATLSHLSYFFEREKEDLDVNLAFAEARAKISIVGGRHLLEAIDLYSTHGLHLIERRPQLDPDGSRRRQMLERLLDLYCDAGMRYEIIETADDLLAIEPDHPQALGAKAEALCLDGKFEESQSLLQQLIALQPDDLRWRQLSLLAMRETGTTPQQRIEQCKTWAAEYPVDGRFQVLTASLLLDQQQEDEARAVLKECVARGAADAMVLEHACELMDALDMRQEADAMIETALAEHAQIAWPHEVKLRRLWRANRVDDAMIAMLDTQRRVEHIPASLHRVMALVCIAAQRLDQARELVAALRDHAEDMKPSEADQAWAQAVGAALQPDRGTLSEHLELLRAAIALNPDDAPLHVLSGDVWMQARESAMALMHYQRAFEIDPAWHTASILYARTLLATGRLDDAYHVSQLVLGRTGHHDARPLLMFVRAYLAMRAAGRLDHQTFRIADVDGDINDLIAHLKQENPGHPEIAALHAEAVMQFQGGAAFDGLAQSLAADETASDDLLLAVANVALAHHHPVAETVLARLAGNPELLMAAALRQARTLAIQSNPAAGLQLIDQALTSSAHASAADHIARIEYMLEYQSPGIADALSTIAARFPDSIDVQHLLLSQPPEITDADLTSRALENLERLVGADSPQVRLARAGLLLRQADAADATLARAIVKIDEVLKESPDSLAALTLMAEASSRGANQNLKRAIECLERAANLYTAEPSLLARLIDLLQQQGEYDRAGRYLRLLARVPDAAEAVRRAELRLWHSQGDFETALARASSIVTEQSSMTDQLILAAIHHRAGKPDEARAIYQRLLSQTDPPPFVLAQAADFYAATGDLQHGLELIAQIKPVDPCTTHDVIAGEFLLRHGEVAAAAEPLQHAARELPHCPGVRATMARYCLAIADRAGARREALEGIRLDPQNADLRTLLTIASLGMPAAERREAIEMLRQLKGNEDLLAVMSLLDQIPESGGTLTPTDLHLQAARRLVEQHARFLPAWHLAIALHVEAGRINEALSLARRAVGRFPAEAEPAQWSTELLMQAGQWQAALADAYEWERRSPVDLPVIQLALATILLELNRAPEAVNELQTLHETFLEQRERWPQRLALYLRALVLAGHIDRATAVITPLLHEDPRWRTHWLELALAADEQYGPGMLTMLQHDAATGDELLQLAGAWIELGKSGCADCLQHAESIALNIANHGDPRIEVGALLIRGGIAEARREWKQAESLYRQALARDADHPILLNNLAYVLTRLSRDADEALRLIDRALTLQPDHADLLDTKALVLLSMDRAAEAEQIARRAAQLRPDDLRIAMSLAEAHLRQPDADGGEAMIRDLQQRLKLQRRVDPDLLSRLESLREKWEQSQIETGT